MSSLKEIFQKKSSNSFLSFLFSLLFLSLFYLSVYLSLFPPLSFFLPLGFSFLSFSLFFSLLRYSQLGMMKFPSQKIPIYSQKLQPILWHLTFQMFTCMLPFSCIKTHGALHVFLAMQFNTSLYEVSIPEYSQNLSKIRSKLQKNAFCRFSLQVLLEKQRDLSR